MFKNLLKGVWKDSCTSTYSCCKLKLHNTPLYPSLPFLYPYILTSKGGYVPNNSGSTEYLDVQKPFKRCLEGFLYLHLLLLQAKTP